MSIMDALLIFSDEQLLTATADSENTIDLGAGKDVWDAARACPEIADGKPLYLNIAVGDTALDSAGEAATLTVSLVTGATSTPATTVFSTAAIAEASLGAGAIVLSMPLPLGLARYNKLTYTVGTEDFTGGNINAWIGMEPIRAV